MGPLNESLKLVHLAEVIRLRPPRMGLGRIGSNLLAKIYWLNTGKHALTFKLNVP